MIGGYSKNQDDQEGLDKIKGWQGFIEGKAGKNFDTFEPLEYSTQAHNGSYYNAKIKVGDDEYIHAKIHEPDTTQENKATEVLSVKENVGRDDDFNF